MSGGLAVAESLGRFGTEGIYSAYYWTYPPDRSPAYWAFRAYRNFDDKGGRFLDRSAPVLLNHDPGSPLHAEVGLESCGTASAARAFSYSGNARGFAARPEPDRGDGKLEVAVEPYSITVIEVTLGRTKT